jgi:hypothetical protein
MMFTKTSILLSQLLLLNYFNQGIAIDENQQMSLRNSNAKYDNQKRNLGETKLQFIKHDVTAGSLKICQGDCDKDSDCAHGLKCFHRSANQHVPGCTGDKAEWKGIDFCYKPPLGTLKIVGDEWGHGFPLNNCEGDCDSDSDCKKGLKCFHRHNLEPVPGCKGDKSSYSGKDFCYKP